MKKIGTFTLLAAGAILTFYLIVLPLLDNLSTFIQSVMNSKMLKFQLRSAELQKEINQITDDKLQEVNVIGFNINSQELEEEDYE